jgi:hypothetical protein
LVKVAIAAVVAMVKEVFRPEVVGVVMVAVRVIREPVSVTNRVSFQSATISLRESATAPVASSNTSFFEL